MQAPVSVIIPCYRCTDTIARALESVARQSWQAQEIFLVEDCSCDAGQTLALLYRLQQSYAQLPIQVIELERNQGPGGARNAGWSLATCPYLAFLDADDSWHPRKLEIQYQWMAAHPDVVLTTSQTLRLQGGERVTELTPMPKSHAIRGRSLLLFNCFATRAVMLQRNIALRFDPEKRHAEDYLLWLRMVLGGMPAALIELPLAYSYKSDYGVEGISADLWKMHAGELDTFSRVRREGLLSLAAYGVAIAFSSAKFLRRLLLCMLLQRQSAGAKA